MSSIEQDNSIKFSDTIVTNADIKRRLATIASYSEDDTAIVAEIDTIETALDVIDARAAIVMAPRQADRT